MGKLKALIVDDEPLIRAELRAILEKLGTAEVVGGAASAKEALKLISALDYDLVFLDIQMPGLTGLEVAEKLKERPKSPMIIFVTAYSRYAPKAFDLDAVDYILKPFDEDRVRHAVEKAIKWREVRDAEPKAAEEAEAASGMDVAPGRAGLEAPEEQAAASKDGRLRLERLPVEKGGKTVLIPYQDIVYAKAYEDYSYINTAREAFLTSFSLKMLEERFKGSRFFRAHRKFLVNLDQVTEIVSMPGGNFLLRTKGEKRVEIPLSRRRVKLLKKIIGL